MKGFPLGRSLRLQLEEVRAQTLEETEAGSELEDGSKRVRQWPSSLSHSLASLVVFDLPRYNPNYYLWNTSLYVCSRFNHFMSLLLYHYSYCFIFSKHICKCYTLKMKSICLLATGNHLFTHQEHLPQALGPIEPARYKRVQAQQPGREKSLLSVWWQPGRPPKPLLQTLWPLWLCMGAGGALLRCCFEREDWTSILNPWQPGLSLLVLLLIQAYGLQLCLEHKQGNTKEGLVVDSSVGNYIVLC